jgi:hypothetical protein
MTSIIAACYHFNTSNDVPGLETRLSSEKPVASRRRTCRIATAVGRSTSTPHLQLSPTTLKSEPSSIQQTCFSTMAAFVSAHAVAYRIAKQRQLSFGVMFPRRSALRTCPRLRDTNATCVRCDLRTSSVRLLAGRAPQCREGPIASSCFMPNPPFVLKDELAALDPTRLSDY